jgi:hypothetical protein
MNEDMFTKLVRPELASKLIQWRSLTESLLQDTGASDITTLYAAIDALMRLGKTEDSQAEGHKGKSEYPQLEAHKSNGTNGKPHILDALKIVLGTGEMDLDAILVALKERGWEPATTNPRAFLITVLTENKPLFDSIDGQFRIGPVSARETAPKPRADRLLDRILRFLQEAPEPQRAARIASALRVEPQQVRKVLIELSEKDLARSRSVNRQLLWEK